MAWLLKRTRQCGKCPWRKDTDPRDIPRGYSEEKHRALDGTIAKKGDLSFLAGGVQRVMACHENHEAHCIGWLMNQLGEGNNIGLRVNMIGCENMQAVTLVGEQHECFEDTLPREIDYE